MRSTTAISTTTSSLSLFLLLLLLLLLLNVVKQVYITVSAVFAVKDL